MKSFNNVQRGIEGKRIYNHSLSGGLFSNGKKVTFFNVKGG